MSVQVRSPVSENLLYPTSDGRPMAETDLHRILMMDLILMLSTRYASAPLTYVSGNLLIFYERNNRRRHVAPDVFVAFGVAKRERLNYLLWQERKGPDVVFEITSKSTKSEDLVKKFRLYRDVLRVKEYFLFDPYGEYLEPSLQGYRLSRGEYVAIKPLADRLPSRLLGLHLERQGKALRLFDANAGAYLLTPQESAERLATELAQATHALHNRDAEVARLQQELERVRSERQQ